MNSKIRKALSILSATAISAVSLSSVMPSIAADEEYTKFPLMLEAETLEGNVVDPNTKKPWVDVYGKKISNGEYSGEGFAYIQGNTLSLTVNVPEDAMYQIDLKATFLNGEEGSSNMETIAINGVEYNKYISYSTEWQDFSFGMVRLQKGENTIEFLGSKYGYYEVDTITIKEAEFPDLSIADDTLTDPDATPEAKALMKYLKSVYGKNILSGQQEIYGGGHSVETTIRYDASSDKCVDSDGNEYEIDRDSKDTDKDGNTFYWHCTGADGQVYTYNTQNRNYGYNDYDYEMKYIKKTTGELPAIRGFDFGSYCPCYAWDDGVAQRIIDWGTKKNGIVTASWHINVPTVMADYTLGEPLDFSKTTYSEKTDFVTANCMVEGTPEYDYFQLCIKNLAAELTKIQDAGVPIIFRPLHEAEGNGPEDGKGAWFWWAKEGAEVYKQLWDFLRDELQNKYGLHNLIWEQNLYTWSDTSIQWYSGDDKVDIVGYDKYNTQYHRHDGNSSGVPNEDAEAGIFYTLYDGIKGKKIIAMAENDSIPSLNNMQVEHAYWSYFCPWYDSEQAHFVMGEEYQNVDTFTELYQSDFCITLDELPANLYSDIDVPSVTTTAVTTAKDDKETTTTAIGTVTTVASSVSDSDILYGDANLDGKVTLADCVAVLQFIANKEKYPLEEQALINADVYNHGDGISGKDALMIQKYDSKNISSLPVNE